MDAASLDSEVLGYLLNDYESAASLAKDVSRDLDAPLAESDIAASLCRFAASGLAQAFVYDPDSSKYVPVQIQEGRDLRSAWFLATAEGRKRVDDAA